MKTFVKYNDFWHEVDPNTPHHSATLYNLGLGRMTEVDIRCMETVVAESLYDLDWYGTKVLDSDTYKTGWLAPNGAFFGCEYSCHSIQAKFVHKKNEETLEHEGYIKITLAPWYNRDNERNFEAIFLCDDPTKYPTNEQVDFIKKFKGPGKDQMLYYLLRERIMKNKKIKEEWEK